MGRVLLQGVSGDIAWKADMNCSPPDSPQTDKHLVDNISDWLRGLCQHTVLRRAAHDACLALIHPHEAFVYIYRGLEWLKFNQKLSWDDIAKDLGVPPSHIKEFTKAANHETGVRHASISGKKLRATYENYSSWVCALIDCINMARARLESGFVVMTSENVADAVKKAAPINPYP